MGMNARLKDASVVAELDSMLAGRLIAINVQDDAIGVKQTVVDYQGRLDEAIKYARIHTKRALQDFIAKMDPVAFEWLIRALLVRLNFVDVEVTKPSNDGGVDLRATMRVGGIDAVVTAVQVKRTKDVGRPTVQALRGSLSAHESGLLVTSGHFSDGAKIEARDLTKTRIALLDGNQLVDLLMEYNIGAKEEIYRSYKLKISDLTVESLKQVTARAVDMLTE